MLEWLTRGLSTVVTLDKLTDAGNLDNLESVAKDSRRVFIQGDLGDGELVARLKRLRSKRESARLCAGIRFQMGRAFCEGLLSTGYNNCSNR